MNVVVDPASKRLQLLQPFDAWDGKDLEVTPYPSTRSALCARLW